MSEAACFSAGKVTIYLQDALEGMSKLSNKSFDLAIADPPYGASTKATWRLESDHGLSGFGGSWKLASHTWDKLSGIEGFDFTLRWLDELKRLVKPTGSIWVHSTYHNSGIVNVGCQLLGLEIINEVVWFKRNAFPNLATRRLTASHESILWVHTGGSNRQYLFNYEDTKAAAFSEDRIKRRGRQLRTVWDIPNNKMEEEIRLGTHPTQKPLRLTARMLLISGIRGGRLLVPFVGSGTELVAGLRYGMEGVGFENDPEYFALASRRVGEEVERQGRQLDIQL